MGTEVEFVPVPTIEATVELAPAISGGIVGVLLPAPELVKEFALLLECVGGNVVAPTLDPRLRAEFTMNGGGIAGGVLLLAPKPVYELVLLLEQRVEDVPVLAVET
jgi:hypothetical protein